MTDGERGGNLRNLVAFWLFGVCNNFGYVIMLTAAQDILDKHGKIPNFKEPTEKCEINMDHRHCSIHSASVVLLCNILPGLVIKIVYPLIAARVPYGVRHAVICLLQAISLLVVALTDSVTVALVGVILSAVSSGMGESTYLALASHYSKFAVHSWSSGTGMAGVCASLAYAGMTDHRLLALSSRTAMLITLIIPFIFLIAYYFVLNRPETVRKVSMMKPHSWISLHKLDKTSRESSTDSETTLQEETPCSKISRGTKITMSLMKYMVPLFTVYFAQYLVNQGLFELMAVFDCSHGFETSTRAQYRWCQVLYEIGVFIARSSANLCEMNMFWIQLLPILQVINMVFLLFNAIHSFLPHFGILGLIVLYEGLIAGAAYVNTFNHIHKKVDPSIRETALAVVTIADTSGIVVAAIVAMPVHNAICKLPL